MHNRIALNQKHDHALDGNGVSYGGVENQTAQASPPHQQEAWNKCNGGCAQSGHNDDANDLFRPTGDTAEKKKGWSWFSAKEEEVKPPPREDVSDGDKHAKVALVVVQVAPRVAAAGSRAPRAGASSPARQGEEQE